MVSDYRLDGWSLILGRGKDFSSPIWGSLSLLSAVLSLEVKHGWGVKLTIYPSLLQRSRMSMSYTFCPQMRSWHIVGQLCFTEICTKEKVKLSQRHIDNAEVKSDTLLVLVLNEIIQINLNHRVCSSTVLVYFVLHGTCLLNV
jgi:hypothetical protein